MSSEFHSIPANAANQPDSPFCGGLPKEFRTASTDAFNTGAPETLSRREAALLKDAKASIQGILGVSLDELSTRVDMLTRPDILRSSEGAEVFSSLHDASKLLFMQWERIRQDRGPRELEFAVAKAFNTANHNARRLNEKYRFVEQPEIAEFARAVQEDALMEYALRHQAEARGQVYVHDTRNLATAMDKAVSQRTEASAWMQTVLPTHPRQHYGRILLAKVPLPKDPRHPEDPALNAFITQPFFTERAGTLIHTHGINIAMSAPLGEGGVNSHRNQLYKPRGGNGPLLKIADQAHDGIRTYDNDTIVVIRPRDPHMIIGNRGREVIGAPKSPSIEELVRLHTEDPRKLRRMLEGVQFGLLGSMHLYRPDIAMAREFVRDHPFKDDRTYFENADMFVFEGPHVWAGGGGAWPERNIVNHMENGTHCGRCFEHDPRDRDLDPVVVLRNFVNPEPKLISYSRKDLRGPSPVAA